MKRSPLQVPPFPSLVAPSPRTFKWCLDDIERGEGVVAHLETMDITGPPYSVLGMIRRLGEISTTFRGQRIYSGLDEKRRLGKKCMSRNASSNISPFAIGAVALVFILMRLT